MICQLKNEHSLAMLLQAANLPRSTFYYQLEQAKKGDKYATLKRQIKAVYDDHKGRYGYRRVTLELRQQGYHHNHKLVARLMREMNLKALIRRKKYSSYPSQQSRQQNKIVANKLQRRFAAKRANKRWLTDITEFKVGADRLYLSPVLDCFNNEIISYSIAPRAQYVLVKSMLDKALKKLPKNREHKLMLHSDQGWHYQMNQYKKQLQQHGIEQSMSRKGNCLDNAKIECFFGTLKAETIHIDKPQNIAQLEQQIHDYIYYYNHKRIQQKLKGLSPIQYKKAHQV